MITITTNKDRSAPSTVVIDSTIGATKPIHLATDFELCAAFLYHGGEHKDFLSGEEHEQLFAMADGYGRLTRREVAEKEIGWDWSHVRDSKKETIEKIAAQIKRILVDNILQRRQQEISDETRRLESERRIVVDARTAVRRSETRRTSAVVDHWLANASYKS